MKLKTFSIIITGIIFVYLITVKVSESNMACGTCHDNEHLRWKTSSHKTIDCIDCHIDPGMSGAVDAQVKGIGNLFTAVFKGTDIQPHEAPVPVSTQNCLGCHASILRVNEIGWGDLPENTLKGQGLKIGHSTHVEKYTIDCVECHRGIIHRDPNKYRRYPVNWPFMNKDCMVCHDGNYSERFKVEVTDVEDKGKCTVCHPYYEPPPDYEQ